MEPEIKKINSLLKFYYKNDVDIALKIKSLIPLIVRGKIMKKNYIGDKYIIMRGREITSNTYKNPIKIFIEDVELNSIIPLDYERKENKNKRSPLPPALRYKILKRDRNTCQSCGARSPEVELEVDHKIPVSKGGTDNEDNLITRCRDCNRGKSDQY